MANFDDRAATLHDVNRVEEKLEEKIDKVDGKIDRVANDVTDIKVVLKELKGQMDGFLKGKSMSISSVATTAGIVTAIGVIFGLVVNYLGTF